MTTTFKSLWLTVLLLAIGSIIVGFAMDYTQEKWVNIIAFGIWSDIVLVVSHYIITKIGQIK